MCKIKTSHFFLLFLSTFFWGQRDLAAVSKKCLQLKGQNVARAVMPVTFSNGGYLLGPRPLDNFLGLFKSDFVGFTIKNLPNEPLELGFAYNLPNFKRTKTIFTNKNHSYSADFLESHSKVLKTWDEVKGSFKTTLTEHKINYSHSEEAEYGHLWFDEGGRLIHVIFDKKEGKVSVLDEPSLRFLYTDQTKITPTRHPGEYVIENEFLTSTTVTSRGVSDVSLKVGLDKIDTEKIEKSSSLSQAEKDVWSRFGAKHQEIFPENLKWDTIAKNFISTPGSMTQNPHASDSGFIIVKSGAAIEEIKTAVLQQIKTDKSAMESLKVSQAKLANPLRKIKEAINMGLLRQGSKFEFSNNKFELTVFTRYSSPQLSPFGDEIYSKLDIKVTKNLPNGSKESFEFSGITGDLIEKYGFFIGEGNPYRNSPQAIFEFFYK